jgi:hypothetical protein
MTAVFLLATLLPYVIAALVVRGRRDRQPVPPDRERFEEVLLGTGGLSGILHVLLFTGHLSVAAVTAAGVIGVVIAWQARRAGMVSGAMPAGEPAAPGYTRIDAWMGWLSACAVAAACGVWLVWSAASRDVAGTDAAHYHIPHAANYALGASPWGPMPTRHGYPMAASVFFAWFILPFGDAFIVDASMVLWYVVLIAALASLFHTLTGLRGWTWVPWLVMVLFGMPLIRAAALPSADLPYAASFLAVSAQLAWMVDRGAFSLRDWVVLGMSLGLLVGCKTPGVYSAAALVSSAGVAQFARRRRPTRLARAPWPAVMAMAAAVGLLTGGIWLVRNVWLFGQPVETYTDRFYLSVMQDVRTVYGGDWFYACRRAGIKIARLLDPHFLAWGAAIAWLIIESAAIVLRRRSAPLAAVRLWCVGLLAIVAGVHVAGLVGAPWTSLEWTDGSSLRYLLPFWVLYAFLAFVGVFSLSLPWHREASLRATGWLLLAAAAVWRAGAVVGAGGINPGPDTLAALIAAAALLAGSAVISSLARESLRPRSAVRLLAQAAVIVAATAGAATWLGGRHAALVAQAEIEESGTLSAWMIARAPDVEVHRRVFLDVRADEVTRGTPCRRRRFFVASRFDFPLELQPVTFTSLVFDSRAVDAVLPLMRRRPEAGVCDYMVVSEDEPTRQAVRLASAWLRPIESSGRFLAYELVRPTDERPRPTR